MTTKIPRVARLLERVMEDLATEPGDGHKNFSELEGSSVALSPRHRKQVGRGCFRFVPDTYDNQADNWKELAYQDTRPIGLRKAKPRPDRVW